MTRTPRTGRPRDSGDFGGYAASAAALNAAYTWPGDKVISRQQIEAWSRRATVNQLDQLPPSPVYRNTSPVRSAPSKIYRTADWVDWARPGVPGPRRKGWVAPEPRREVA